MKSAQTGVILGAVLLVASCSFNPVQRGMFTAADVRAFEDSYNEICAYQYSPGYSDILGRGRVEMTGRYLLELNRSTGLVEIGQIDVVIDFSDREDVRDRTVQVDIASAEISNVTGLPAGSDVATVGWLTDELEIFGSVGVTEAVGPEPVPPDLRIDVEGSKTEISADDSPSTRAVGQVFLGAFAQEIRTGLMPLSVCGTVNDAGINGLINGEFYLEEV